MKKCVVFFALFVLAIVAAAIVDNNNNEEQVELIEEVSKGEKNIENIVAHGGG